MEPYSDSCGGDSEPIGDVSGVLKIPSEPDEGIRTDVERAMSSSSSSDGCPDCCCQVEIVLRDGSKSMLYSRDSEGRRKPKGGDEFYVRYEEYVWVDGAESEEDHPTKRIRTQAVAFITDRGDGSYELDFCTTPMHPVPSPPRAENGRGCDDDEPEEENLVRTITVYFEYTDGIGFLPPPTKRDWGNGGYSHRKHELGLGPGVRRPFLRRFSPPAPPRIDLGRFDRVFAFGDSTFCQFFRQRPNKKGKYYFRDNLRVLGEKVRMGLNSGTVDDLLELLREDETEKLLLSEHGGDDDDDDASNNNDKKKKTALVVGSCLWDILSADDELQGSGFEDHRNACKDYVRGLRERYPDVTVLWKSPMAVHIHWVDLDRVVEHDRSTATLFGTNRIRYMSASRSRFLWSAQKAIMEELGVPFLDLYGATHLSADQLYPSDGRHYRPDLNRKMLGWFYQDRSAPDSINNDNNNNERVYYRQVV